MKRLIRGLFVACISSVMLACGGGSDSPPPPAAPTTLSVEPGDAVNTVQWPAVAGATSYNLYWSETTPVASATAHVVKGVVSPYQHTALTNGVLLYYAVTAVSPNGESTLSPEVGAMPVAPVPSAPTTVNATPGDTMVTLSWSPVSRADSYTLYWSNSPDPMPGGQGVTRIAGIQATSYAHVGLTNGSPYYYRVTAVNTGGESQVSTELSATPLPPAPGAPANLTGTTGDTHAHLSWSAVTGATSYNLYASTTAGIAIGGVGVTQTTGIASTAYEPSGLTNGDTYYFRVSAIGAGGESALSDEISVRPLPPAPPAPLGLTAIAPKDIVQVTVQWFDVTDYPSSNAPIQLGYNIYRGLQPGLATYYKDASRATKIANVTAPFVDATVTKNTTYYYIVTSFVPALPDVESGPSGEVSATTSRAGGGSTGGGEGDTGYTTNLSFPVVFADGYGIAGAKITGTWAGVGPFTVVPTFDYNTGLRPLSTQTLSAFPFLSSTTAVSLGGVTYYPQATESSWQAEWRNNAGGQQMETIVDWGDALLSKTYTASSIVRIETTLKQDATIAGITDTMTAYKMALLSGSQTTELQGTDGTTYASATRNVFALNARLKIEKIATGGGADTVVFDKAVYESLGSTTEGGGSSTTSSKYGAELNMAGTLVYGYNFRLNSVTGVPNKTGQYRITFSLDPQARVGSDTVPNHVKMVGKSDAGATLSADGLSTSVIITVN